VCSDSNTLCVTVMLCTVYILNKFLLNTFCNYLHPALQISPTHKHNWTFRLHQHHFSLCTSPNTHNVPISTFSYILFLHSAAVSHSVMRIPVKSRYILANCSPLFHPSHCPDHRGKSETISDSGGAAQVGSYSQCLTAEL
jgi:hypothetical protein